MVSGASSMYLLLSASITAVYRICMVAKQTLKLVKGTNLTRGQFSNGWFTEDKHCVYVHTVDQKCFKEVYHKIFDLFLVQMGSNHEKRLQSWNTLPLLLPFDTLISNCILSFI